MHGQIRAHPRGAQERTRAQAQRGARTEQSRGRATFQCGTQPLHGPLRGAKVMVTYAFQDAGPEPDEQLSATRHGHQERPQRPR